VKRALRDAAIVAVSATGLPFLRAALLRRRGPLVRVLTVHDVEARHAERFDRMLAFLRRHFDVIGPDDLAKGELDRGRINVLLTFDDGYASWHEHALPALRRHEIEPIFFLCSGFLDTAGDPDREAAFCHERLRVRHRRPLDWTQAAELARHGTIGGHTVTHPSLEALAPGERDRELRDDRRTIERRLGSPPEHVAYPFGLPQDAGQEAAAAARAAGYVHGFTADWGFAGGADPMRIPRLNIDPDRSLLLLALSVVGAYDLVHGLAFGARRALGGRAGRAGSI
jgi:peptidoglycan/xylan/chitin deacetylase (PgdA/CDA1 family)